MDAVVVRRGESRPRVIDLPRPDPGPGEVVVRTLRVGVDGTDRDVVRGTHGAFPDGESRMVLGHEAVGVVTDPNGTRFDRGEVVTPTVRRPPGGDPDDRFTRDEADMLPPGATLERGIDGADGFMSEFFTSHESTLVEVPPALAEWGFLVEPLSVVEKALEHAAASRSAFDWRPESALVLGNGSLGLLALSALDQQRRYCLGRRDRPDPTVDLMERLGATYVDSRETPVPAVPDEYEPVDLVVEATGHARHALEAPRALAPGGVAALLGLPAPSTFEVDGGEFHRDLVMHNKALVGTVNASVDHFRAAVDTLETIPDDFLADFLTGVHPPADCEAAFDRDDATVKTVVEFATR